MLSAGDGDEGSSSIRAELGESPAQAPSEAALTPGSEPSCDWSCTACEPDTGCLQVCAEIGDCGSACDVVAHCEAELDWDEASCACVRR